MFSIEGSRATATCFATQLEESAIEQIRTMCDQPFADGSRIRIMPDAHAGIGCTIGTTMTITDKVVPNLVGVDLGCGMLTVDIGRKELDLPEIDAACHAVPSGKDVWEGRRKRFNLSELRCYRDLRDTRRLERSIGTLGGGNHFIEVDVASDGTNYLVIHSGSRNLGLQVAVHYQNLAIDLRSGMDDYYRKRDDLIAEYKAAGRRHEISKALTALRSEFKEMGTDVPRDLCWLDGKYMDDYLHDVKVCQDFARLNRETIAEEILRMCGLQRNSSFHTVHNYIDTDEMILRKGAIAAHDGEVVLIPLNMRDGSVMAVGRGVKDWNYSAPHGAGRVMSRTVARSSLSVSEYRKAMEGIYTTSVCESTLDEAPFAYKSAEDIIDAISESVDVIEVMRPVFNFKAS